MSETNSHSITEQELNTLEDQVETLINSCSHLREENRILRVHQETLQHEKSALLKKNNMAKTRVDAMITRLKSLEANT